MKENLIWKKKELVIIEDFKIFSNKKSKYK